MSRKETGRQIDSVRSRILLQQTLIRWRAMHQHVLDLPNTANAHRAHHLQSQTLQRWIKRLRDKQLDQRAARYAEEQTRIHTARIWRRWRMELVRRRTERWQREMRARERGFTARKTAMLLHDVFMVSCRWTSRKCPLIHVALA